jgi:hypothetical protein
VCPAFNYRILRASSASASAFPAGGRNAFDGLLTISTPLRTPIASRKPKQPWPTTSTSTTKPQTLALQRRSTETPWATSQTVKLCVSPPASAASSRGPPRLGLHSSTTRSFADANLSCRTHSRMQMTPPLSNLPRQSPLSGLALSPSADPPR